MLDGAAERGLCGITVPRLSSGWDLANALTGAALYSSAYLMELKVGSLFVLFSFVPVWMALANLLPKGQNDGAVLREASRSLQARKLLFRQLEMAQLIEEKVPFADLPDAYFACLRDTQYQKSFLVDYSTWSLMSALWGNWI